MTDRPIEELVAGDKFRDTLVPRADHMNGAFPMWYGWAIMDAFLAGIDYARKATKESTDGDKEAESKGTTVKPGKPSG
jgi:hypothetical protein